MPLCVFADLEIIESEGRSHLKSIDNPETIVYFAQHSSAFYQTYESNGDGTLLPPMTWILLTRQGKLIKNDSILAR